ncbi:glycosyltransferase [Brooklawnia sp.]|uniref:glycosyltransferase n=1 Tax=Brooklawnia sp. TaxID=2699740 RepID=UPI00311E60C4
MARLRIAQLANFVSETSGGMKVAIDRLGSGYLAAGAERMLIIPGRRDKISETEMGVVAEVRAPRLSSTYRMIAEPWRAFDVLRRFRPTSVESSDKWTLSGVGGWAARHSVGSVLFSHERLDDMAAGWSRSRRLVRPLVAAMNRRLATGFDIVVVTSDYSAGEWSGLSADLRKVPLGVDLETFNPDKGAPDPGPGPLQLCYVGRMSHEKHPQLGVAAAAELHRRGVGFELHMYGTGPDLKSLRAQAGRAPVQFHGFVAGRDDVARRLAASDISLSVSPTETFGLAVLEALACGTPVVTADRGGARELITSRCGEWGSPDACGIADAIELLADRLSPQVRTAARSHAAEYDWQTPVSRMMEIHEQAAEKGRRAR